MSKVTGYFLRLSSARYYTLNNRMYEKYAEPVPDFSHSRNIPLICFIIDDNGIISHIGSGKRGFLAGTDLRRLNIENIYKLTKPLSAIDIAQATPSRNKHSLTVKINDGGIISPKSFEAFLKELLKKSEEVIPILSKYSTEKHIRIEKLSKEIKNSLAEQKEAILTALNIAGIDKSVVGGWDYSEDVGPISFLDGIKDVRLREDSMVMNDLVNIPGFNYISTTKYSASKFMSRTAQLTVILANRLPLEELLGTDLIYYNEDFKSFIMVQYKVMEKESEQFLFRVPNSQLDEEIKRMDSILAHLNSIKSISSIDDYRINENPFFIKICPRIDFDPDNIGLSTGIYLPIDYFKMLQTDQTIKGSRGGMAISYDNVGRYFDNTAFKTIIEGGWIGTNISQSKILEDLIKSTIESGKAAVLAVKEKYSEPKPVNEENDKNDFNIDELPF